MYIWVYQSWQVGMIVNEFAIKHELNISVKCIGTCIMFRNFSYKRVWNYTENDFVRLNESPDRAIIVLTSEANYRIVKLIPSVISTTIRILIK